MTTYETMRIRSGLADTGGYLGRCFAVARQHFMAGHSLDVAIRKAREKFGF